MDHIPTYTAGAEESVREAVLSAHRLAKDHGTQSCFLDLSGSGAPQLFVGSSCADQSTGEVFWDKLERLDHSEKIVVDPQEIFRDLISLDQ